MTPEEQRLLERLRLVEALHAGGATAGERAAAQHARDRILARLKSLEQTDRPEEYRFSFTNQWSRRLLVALLRRYGIKPYRRPGQRYTTVMARVPKRFVDETLWPEFMELNKTLTSYIEDVASRVIAEAMQTDDADVEVQAEPAGLAAGSGAVDLQDS